MPVKLAYNVFEPKSGADKRLSPVIFLHALTANKEYWGDLPQLVADETRRKTFAIDARNHGDSEYVEQVCLDVNAVDLVHFMDTLLIPKTVLIGESLGGVTAIRTALEKPERVEKILSSDVGVKKMTKDIIFTLYNYVSICYNAVKSIPKHLDEKEAQNYVLDAIYSKLPQIQGIVPSKKSLSLVDKVLIRRPNGEYDLKYNVPAFFEAIKHPEAIQTDPEGIFNGPALFLYGEVSIFNVGKEKDHIKQHFPKAEFIEFEGGGHNLSLEFPDKCYEIVMKFLLDESDSK